MNRLDKFRKWLHERGLHRFCRVRRIYHDVNEYIVSPTGERIDITSFGGYTTVAHS